MQSYSFAYDYVIYEPQSVIYESVGASQTCNLVKLEYMSSQFLVCIFFPQWYKFLISLFTKYYCPFIDFRMKSLLILLSF